jgi:hypothetical protein
MSLLSRLAAVVDALATEVACTEALAPGPVRATAPGRAAPSGHAGRSADAGGGPDSRARATRISCSQDGRNVQALVLWQPAHSDQL